MTRQDYKEYINSPHWIALKQQFEALKTSCAACGVTMDLDIHHRSYSRLWQEQIEDLIRMCRPCHYSTHYFYKLMLKDFNEGKTPFRHTLTEVTDFLLKDSLLFTLVWRGWIAQQHKENNGWVKLNNFGQASS